MGIFFSEKFDTLDDLLLFELEDLYDAESRLTEALPKMADAASAPELKQAFHDHAMQTKRHVDRLRQAFQELDHKPQRETCDAMKGLISEGETVINADAGAAVKDAALIAAAQRVEHYEIAAYGSARTFARRAGHPGVADLLQQTLDEEGETDHRLTAIAERQVNPSAAVAH